MILKPCARCGRAIPYGRPYCETCQPVVDQHRQESKRRRNRRYDAGRDPRTVSFYHSKEWKALSRTVLQEAGYLCEYCGREIATEVDHVVPLDEDWSRRYDRMNLKATCHGCHDKKHGRFGPRGV